MQNDQLLTPREASRHLGVTVTTLSRWARSGRLPAAYTPGGHRRFRLADLQTLQTERERDAPEAEEWEDDAVRLYEQGWSIRKVAQHFDCGYGMMRRTLMRRVTLRTRGGIPRTSSPVQEIRVSSVDCVRPGHVCDNRSDDVRPSEAM